MRTRSLLAGALAVGLALGCLSPAEAAAPSAHPASGLRRSGTSVAPNVEGLVGGSRRFAALADGLPSAVSLERWTVAPRDQKAVNSCTTWTIGYAMLGWYSVYSGSARTYAPMYLYSQIDGGSDGGSSSQDAYAVLARQGIAPRSSYSHGDYDWKHEPRAADRRAAKASTTTAPHYLFNVLGTTTPGRAGRTAIETAIAARHPVALAIPEFAPLTRLDAKHSVLHASAISSRTPVYGLHMVLVVGYDAHGVRIQNSWGGSWGDGGFATLDWAFVERYGLEASWIRGFARDAAPTAPAQPDRVSTTGWPEGDGQAGVSVSWRGTGEYDDAVRHPVTGWAVTLTGSDGSLRTAGGVADDPTATSASFSALPSGVDYTVSVAAANAVGTGPARIVAFSPALMDPKQGTDTDAVAAPPLASQPMPAPAPLPRLAPAAPGLRWPQLGYGGLVARWAAPRYTGHSRIDRYRVTVSGLRGGRVVVRRTWTVPASARSRSVAWSRHGVPVGLSGYRVAVQAHSIAGRWGASVTTTAHVDWRRGGMAVRLTAG